MSFMAPSFLLLLATATMSSTPAPPTQLPLTDSLFVTEPLPLTSPTTMALPLNNVALVTGSSRGLGREIALALAFQGASIVLTCVKHYDSVHEVKRQIEEMGRKAIFIRADITKPNSISSLFKIAVTTFGKLDIVVSNAGVVHFKPLADTTPDEFDQVFNANTRGQFFVAQQAFKHLKEGGRLILTSSTAARQTSASYAVYSASKAAVEAFARSLAAGRSLMVSDLISRCRN